MPQMSLNHDEPDKSLENGEGPMTLIKAAARAIMETRDNGGCLVQDWNRESRENPHVAQAWRQSLAVFNAIEQAGNRVVPVEPTMEMTTFGDVNAEDAFNDFHKTILRACGCHNCDVDSHDAFAAIYTAMLKGS